MAWKPRTLRETGRMICGDAEHFRYRSSRYITRFFEDCDLDFEHRGETRADWCADRVGEVLDLPRDGSQMLPDAFVRIIRRLLDSDEAEEGDPPGLREGTRRPESRTGTRGVACVP